MANQIMFSDIISNISISTGVVRIEYAILSEVNNEIVYSVMPQGMDPKTTKLELYEIIEEHMTKVASHKRRTPEVSAA